MYKIAAIIGGVLLMAGVALAGTVSSLGSTGSPSISQTIPTASRRRCARKTAQSSGAAARPRPEGGRTRPGEDVRERTSAWRPSRPTIAAAAMARDSHGRNAAATTAARRPRPQAATTDSPREDETARGPSPGPSLRRHNPEMSRPKRTHGPARRGRGPRSPSRSRRRSSREGYATRVAGDARRGARARGRAAARPRAARRDAPGRLGLRRLPRAAPAARACRSSCSRPAARRPTA